MGRPMKLTPQVHHQIVSLVQGGTYITVAARAAGITKSTLYRWLERGKRARSGPYREFWLDLMQASATARATAEVKVKQTNPLAWLRYGPGRSRPGDPGWTEVRGMGLETAKRDTMRRARQLGLDPDEVWSLTRALLEEDGDGPEESPDIAWADQ